MALGELPPPQNAYGNISQVVAEFLSTMGHETQFSVVARGESSLDSTEPRVIDVFYSHS